MHSKTAGARWAGLCIAHKTALLCKPIVIECAKSWVGVALPMLMVRFLATNRDDSSAICTEKRNCSSS
jgi:hypothetical protein